MLTREQIRARRRQRRKLEIILAVILAALVVSAAIYLTPDRDIPEPVVIVETRAPAIEAVGYIEPQRPPEELSPEPIYYLDPDERDLVAAACYFEDRSGGISGMMAVAEVIYNRLRDGRFGASIVEICTPGQFHGLREIGSESVSIEAYEAVKRVFDYGMDAGTNGAVWFCTGNPNGIKRGLVKVATVGGHAYYAG